MSDSKGGSNEPSMEEILASIRRIIAEDAEQDEKSSPGSTPPRSPAASENSEDPEAHWPEDREAETDPPSRPERTPLPEDDDAPLELTQLVNEDGSVTDLSEGGGPAMPFVADDGPSEERREETPTEPAREETRTYEDTQPVVQTHHESPTGETESTQSEVEDAELDEGLAAAGATPSEAQVESEVRAWLDRNLPDIVERVVREEVERMLRRLKDG